MALMRAASVVHVSVIMCTWLLVSCLYGPGCNIVGAQPVSAPAPAPVYVYPDTWVDTACNQYPARYQVYEEEAMRKLRDAWNRSVAGEGRYNISGWWDYEHPCDRTSDYSGWRGIRCSGVLASDGTETVCSLFILELGAIDRGISGELIPEIGNLRNLQYIRIANNPGLTGSIPSSIWELPNLKEVSIMNNALDGSIVFSKNSTKPLNSLERIDLSQNKFTSWQNDGKPFWNLEYLNLSNNEFSGNFNLGRFGKGGWFEGGIYTALMTLDLSNNNFDNMTGSPNSAHDDMPSLQALYMRNNSFRGALTYINTFLNSPRIQLLYFDNNGLSGTLVLPTISFENSSLNTLSLTDNGITSIDFPTAKTDTTLSRNHLQIASILFLGGNPLCNSSDNSDPIPVICRYNHTSKVRIAEKERSNTRNIVLVSAIPVGILLLVIFILAYIFLKNRREHRYLLLNVQQKFAEHELKPTLFTYSELQKATRDFHPDNRLGEGAFGAVYRGELPDGTEVAVKLLFNTSQQSMDEFLNEVVLLTGIKHRNLVKLKGCCLRGDRRLLVYEYVDNSDLADVLFGRTGMKGDNRPLLSWPERYNICLGVAQGLHYLHALVDPKIIHRDIKASNILLDAKMEAKIADFGMALLFPSDMSHVMTVHIAGTKGYLAPEYASMGQLSEKADVWSYGVLLLEVVAGRNNIDGTLEPEKIYLATWAGNMHERGTLMDVVDPDLELRSDKELQQVERVVRVALLCLQNAPDHRPTMAQVVTMLQNDMDVPVVKRNYQFAGAQEQQSDSSQITIPQGLESHHSRDALIEFGAPSSTVELSALQAR